MSIEDINLSGYCVIPGFIDASVIKALSKDIDDLMAERKFKPAAVGQGSQKQEAGLVRRDQICWIDSLPQTPLRNELLLKMEILRQSLNEKLLLGLFQLDILYSIYEKGAFYKRHSDVFKNDDSRVISTVLYLNEHWREGHGGELILYTPGPTGAVTVEPRGGTLVCFLSSIEHEVRETSATRKSCAGWYKKRGEFLRPS